MEKLCAFVDESIRGKEGRYVLAAALVESGHHEAHRKLLRSLLMPKQRRLHWHDERPSRREYLCQALSDLAPVATVVVGTGLIANKQARARAKCLQHMLYLLTQQGVRHVLIERRDPVGNAADHKTIIGLRAAHLLASDVSVDWGDPAVEELLWLPDFVAGAAAYAEAGDARYLSRLGEGITVRRFSID